MKGAIVSRGSVSDCPDGHLCQIATSNGSLSRWCLEIRLCDCGVQAFLGGKVTCMQLVQAYVQVRNSPAGPRKLHKN